MPNLSLIRLTELLEAIAERCADVCPSSAATLDDEGVVERINEWFRHNYSCDELENVAVLCESNGLIGDAQRLREFRFDLVRRWMNLGFHDLARDEWSPDEVAFYRQLFGTFPMPLADPVADEEVQRDRRAAVFGSIVRLGDYVRSLSELIKRSAYAETTDPVPPAANVHSGQQANSDAIRRLLRLFTDGVVDERLNQAAAILQNEKLDANEKLTKIDSIIPLPVIASAEKLGDLVGVSKQRIAQTDWWVQHRKGEKAVEVGRRRSVHMKRAEERKQGAKGDPCDADK